MGHNRRTYTALLALILVLALSAGLSHTAHASDDSNNGGLGLSNSGKNDNTTQTITTSENTIKTIDQLSKGTNNTTYQNLVNQLKNQVRQGNMTAADQTLQDLRRVAYNDTGTTLTLTTVKLIESLKLKPDGLTIDPNLLNSLLGQPDSKGIPVGIQGMDPKKAASDLNILSQLIQGIDPRIADNLSQDVFNIQDSLLHGLFDGTNSPNNASTRPIDITGLTGPVITPNIPHVTPLTTSFAGMPNIPLVFPLLAMILAIIGTLSFLILRKPWLQRRLSPLTSRIRSSRDEAPENYHLNTPKDMIIYYFRKATRIMGGRGVPKEYYETHREFSAKCTMRAEAEPISNVSGLYEKAMFSGREAQPEDANDAGRSVSIIETSGSSTAG